MHKHSHSADTEGMVIHWAWAYDYLLKISTLGRERHMRQKIVDTAAVKKGDRVLDVGCGTGTLALVAAVAAGVEGRVYGVDPAAEMIARAQSKAKRARITAEFKVGTIEALNFADNSIDVVLSSLMFHHLTEHLQDAGLAEIQRVLKPTGRLVVVDFGTPKQLSVKAQTAGFKVISAAPLGPKFLYAFVAEAGAVETA